MQRSRSARGWLPPVVHTRHGSGLLTHQAMRAPRAFTRKPQD
ncbi:hypothetical protein SXCC_02205 [Gluconacetobacter sp. SXCC-1]|nr:hypothetical protein SXCC_02205 [Gluconacetobacter sp. SXCC-1]